MNSTIFPVLENDLEECAIVITSELNQDLVSEGYHYGFFPWFQEGENFFWFAYNPRCVLFPSEVKISKSMKQMMKRKDFTVTYDKSFREVMLHCANTPRTDGGQTWINENYLEVYCGLHDQGICHSVEVWKDDMLVGGLYGTVINDVFCGESMFHTVSNASKLALIWLCTHKTFRLIDCQVYTDHMSTMGARLIDLESYLRMLQG